MGRYIDYIKRSVNAPDLPKEGGGVKKAEPLPQDIISKSSRYLKERAVWVKAGKPTRLQVDIDFIYEKICVPCPYFSTDHCSICGCFIGRGKHFNKLFWQTTRCPADPPLWTEDTHRPESNVNQSDDVESIPNPIIEQVPEPPPPPKRGGCGCGS